jgi:hypothetical protein
MHDESQQALVHSDICNGKSVFSYQVAYLFSQKNYRVFRVHQEPDNIEDVISFLQGFNSPTLVIFDDLLRFRNLPSAILGMGNSDIVVLATVRSAALETSYQRVMARLGNSAYIEIDLNTPQVGDSQRIITYLNANGLLGKHAELSENEKRRFVEKKCGGQLRDLILSLYQTGALHARVEEVLQNIQKLDSGVRDLIVFSALLTYSSYQDFSQLSILSDLVGYDGMYEDLKRTLADHELSTLVRIDAGDLTVRSPALAEFILRRVFNVEAVLEIVKRALFVLDNYYTDDPDFEHLGKGLLKYSLYGSLMQGDKENDVIERFYDECRVLSFTSNDPLFFVQRSICNMKWKRFDISNRFVETAYALGPVEIQDSHFGRTVIQAPKGVCDGSLLPDGCPVGEDGTALSWQAHRSRPHRQ